MVRFLEETHEYFTENNVKLTPVTTVIESLGDKFVATIYNTRKTREKFKMTHEEVLRYWDTLKQKSIIRGTNIHKYIEKKLRYQTVIVGSNVAVKERKNIDSFLRKKKLFGKTRKKFHVEQLLYDEKALIAGQSDLVIEYRRYIEILDWKTNDKTIEELQKSYRKFYGEFSFLPQSKFNGYVIQLCLYALLAEKVFGKPCKKISIVHINQDVVEYVIDTTLMQRVKTTLQKIFKI